MKTNSKITLTTESVDKEAMENKLYQILKQEAMDFSSNYLNPLDLWDIEVITREDRDEYQAGDASLGSDYRYAVKWGYDAAVDIALEDHEWTYVMVYEEPESEEDLKNQYTFDDVVNIITQSYLRDRYEEIQCGSFEHGHFKYIVFVEKESKAKATLNENTKFTLTIGQLKRLVKESRKLTVEHEEVSVVTPSGEHLGMVDDEGNFVPGEYPSDRFDCGELVDNDGEYAKDCGKFFKEYGYKDAPSRNSSVDQSKKYLMVSDKPKDEEFHEFFKEFWPKYLAAGKDKSSKEYCDLIRQFKAGVRRKLPITGDWSDDDKAVEFMNIGGNKNKNGLLLLSFSYYGPSRPGRTDFHSMCFLVDEYGRIPKGASAYRELSRVDSVNILEKWKKFSDDE